MKHWRAWQELARISNLPTVWTNVLAGWLLAGGGWNGGALGWLLAGGSLMYTAGMILNDAWDVRFDREHRTERPIPSGRVSMAAAWGVGAGMLVAGGAMCFWGAGACGWLVLGLAGAILVYDAYHKPWAGSVLIMGSCRTLLYLVAGSAVTGGLGLREDANLIVRSIALGAYVVGLSLVARNEARPSGAGVGGRWVGRLALGLPLLAGLAMWVSVGGPGPGASEGAGILVLQGVLMVILGGLIALAIRRMRTPPPSNIGRAVGLLLAGIVVVDAVAVCPIAPLTSVFFAAATPVLLLWQRKVAAT